MNNRRSNYLNIHQSYEQVRERHRQFAIKKRMQSALMRDNRSNGRASYGYGLNT